MRYGKREKEKGGKGMPQLRDMYGCRGWGSIESEAGCWGGTSKGGGDLDRARITKGTKAERYPAWEDVSIVGRQAVPSVLPFDVL